MFSENKRKYMLFLFLNKNKHVSKIQVSVVQKLKNNTTRPLKLIVILKVFMLEEATGI